MFKVLARNAVSNWMGFAAQVAITFWLTPFVLSTLGDVRYGVWALTASLTGYYGLLDLGFRGGVTQYLTRYLAIEDYAALNRTASSAAVALGGVALVIVLASFVLGASAPALFTLPEQLHDEAFWCIVIVGASAGIQCFFFPFSALFAATQRYDLSNAIGITTRLLTAGLTLAALQSGYGLVGVALATSSGNLVDYVLRWQVSQRLVPQLCISLAQFSVGSWREVWHFGAWNFISSISQTMILQVGLLVIGFFLPVAAVTHFVLATSLNRYLRELLRGLGQVFFPAATHLSAAGKTADLRRLYLDGSRFALCLTAGLAVMLGCWSDDFYRLWVGSEYVSGKSFPSVALLFRLLLIATVCNYVSGIGRQVLLGCRFVRPLALTVAAEATANLTLSVLLIGPLGLVGVAVANIVPAFLAHAIVIPILVTRRLDLHLRTFLTHACLRPIAFGCVASLIAMQITRLGPCESWLELGLQISLAMVLGVPLMLLFALDGSARRQLIWKRIPQSWIALLERRPSWTRARAIAEHTAAKE